MSERKLTTFSKHSNFRNLKESGTSLREAFPGGNPNILKHSLDSWMSVKFVRYLEYFGE